MAGNSVLTKELESEIVINNLPYFIKLMNSTKITAAEKLSVLEDVNIDLAVYLESIGEEL